MQTVTLFVRYGIFGLGLAIFLGPSSAMAADCSSILGLYRSGVTPKDRTPLKGESALYMYRMSDGSCGWGTGNGKPTQSEARALAASRCRDHQRNASVPCTLVGVGGQTLGSGVAAIMGGGRPKPTAEKQVAAKTAKQVEPNDGKPKLSAPPLSPSSLEVPPQTTIAAKPRPLERQLPQTPSSAPQPEVKGDLIPRNAEKLIAAKPTPDAAPDGQPSTSSGSNKTTYSTSTAKEPSLDLPDRLRPLVEGAIDDTLILFNTTASAPNLNKNLRGFLQFNNAQARLCEPDAASNGSDATFHLTMKLRSLGATKLRWDKEACQADRFAASYDVMILKRRTLLGLEARRASAFIAELDAKGITDFIVVRKSDIENEEAGREIIRSQIQLEVVNAAKAGFGFIALPAGKPIVCLAISDAKAVHDQLISQKAEALQFLWKTLEGITLVPTTTENAFISMKRGLCSAVYASGDDLKQLALALKRDNVSYTFVDAWVSPSDFDGVASAIAAKQSEKEVAIETARQRENSDQMLREAREKAEGEERRQRTATLQQRSAARTKGLVDDLDLAVTSILDGSTNWKGLWSDVRGSETHLNDLKGWYQQRRSEGWEPQKREISLLDYGKSLWNERQLETVYIRSTIWLKNRTVGEYRSYCWIFTYLIDDEFKLYREQSSIACDQADTQINLRKQRTRFASEWIATKN